MLACAALLVVGGLVSWFTIPHRVPHTRCLRSAACAYDGEPGWRPSAALALLLGACSERRRRATGPTRRPAAEPSQAGRSPSKRPGACRSPTPTHAVDPPGKRDGRLWSADILVQWDKPLDDDLLKRIEKLKGVAHTERIGLGQVSLENRVLTVASVDPGGYRNFTQADVADFQEAWDRVAGGEMATDQKVAKRLADQDGMIRLGSEDDDAPTLHVGAYTPQIPTIDMVVNTAWADDIEMATDNGLLISTDGITPATIRKPLEKLVGKDASVQMLDVASLLGLDPDAKLTAIPTGGTIGSVVGTYRYRVIGGGRIAPEPAWVAANIRTEVVPDPRQRHLPQGPVPAAARGAAGGRSSAGWPARSTPTSTPGATTRASSPTPPRCPTTPSASRSTSTSPATGAARSARSTATSSRSSRSGASPGAATGATPTRCTSSSARSSASAERRVLGRP